MLNRGRKRKEKLLLIAYQLLGCPFPFSPESTKGNNKGLGEEWRTGITVERNVILREPRGGNAIPPPPSLPLSLSQVV
jgi:hypothetical protein